MNQIPELTDFFNICIYRAPMELNMSELCPFKCILTSATPPRCHTPFVKCLPFFAWGQCELPCKLCRS